MAFATITIPTPFIDTSVIDNDVLVTDSRMDEDDDMNCGSDNDAHDNNSNKDCEDSEANEDEDEDNDGSIREKTSPDSIEGDSDNDAKDVDEEPEGAGEGSEDADEEPKDADEEPEDADEEPEDGENNEDLETPLARRLRPRRAKTGNYNLSFDHGPQTSSLDTSYHEGPATSDEGSAHESDAGEDLNLDHNSPSSPPTKRRKKSSVTTHSTTVRTKHVNASIPHGSNPTPASIVFGPMPDIDLSENEEELSGHLKCGWLCQEGINEAQELGKKTAEEARVIGAKYGKSVRAILIEAGLSIKHSRSESDWNAHQRWFMDNHPRKDKECQSPISVKEHQRKHYHAMGKENEQWDIIRNYNITGDNTNQSRAKTILSMREDIARKLSAYSRLEGIEIISCIFDTTQDEAARQASGFVAGSDLIVKLINEHQLDARAILDWVVTTTKVKGYNISVPQFMGGVGAYEILLSKPNEAPRDRYRRIWPIMVLEHTSKFGYRPKAVQWRKLLDYAFQYKFMIKNWPDDILPISPEFNPHNLSSQHLKLLVVPFIKRKAHSYYKAELRTEAESLFEIEKKKSKGKHRGQARTVEDVMSELDIDVPEIKFAAWPDECIKQLDDEVPEMFDIPLVTSALDVVLCKLVDSAKYTHETLPSDHESPVTPSPPTLPSNQCPPTNFTAVHCCKENYLPQAPDLFDRKPRPVLPTSRDEPVGGGRQQTSLPFKAKKALWVDPTFVCCMEERPTNSRNDADMEIEPYPRRKDRNFIAPNRRHEYSRSPPVYPVQDGPSHTRHYWPTYRQRETSPVGHSEDHSYPRCPAHSCRHNHANDYNQRFQVRGAGDSHYEDGPSWFRY
ncbi:uncharacterized protein EDB91DRAFT_1244668 [Suillus paluster]|uniref:uncharacterized protein n=1 Tax=Suillus paluster TaxID=48578 RepID=UPI001B875FF8|nr:uncharacterized protein EDB91DRAFT_1244668 [Suillus paluster]KAG1748857.1 hypothetical protein EDB91DRAFT_1244668 [Suillus paluster]